MSQDLRALLERAVLDLDFRSQLRTDPDAAFAGYELTEEDRDILRTTDDRMLGLLGRVLWADVSADAARSAPVQTLGPLDLGERSTARPSIETLVRRVLGASASSRYGHVLDLIRSLARNRRAQ